MKVIKSLGSWLSPQKPTTIRQIIPFVDEYRATNFRFIMFSMSTESCDYDKALDNIFRRLKDCEKETKDRLALELGYCVHIHWKTLLEKLTSSQNTFNEIYSLSFSGSCLSVKQLWDLYLLYANYKKVQAHFPLISINETKAHKAFLDYESESTNSTNQSQEPMLEPTGSIEMEKDSSVIDLSSEANSKGKI